MTNPYYNPTGVPAQGAAVTSAVVRTEFAAIQAGFDKMPTLSGNGNKLVKVNAAGDAMTVSAGIVDAASSTVLTIEATGDATINVSSTSALFIGDAANAAAYRSLLGGSISTAIVTSRTGDDTRNTTGYYIGSASVTPTRLRFYKGRGGTSHATVVDGDVAMELQAYFSDGSAFQNTGAFKFVSAGAVSAGVVPCDFVVTVSATSGAAIAEKFRVKSDGTITLGGTSTAPALKVNPYTAGNWVTISSATNPTISTSAGNLILTAAGGTVGVTGDLGVSSATAFTQISATNTGAGYAALAATSSGTANSYVFLSNTTSGERVRLVADNAGNCSISTGGNFRQVMVTHTASADRYLTLTGSFGANPKISTSAGSLDVGAPVVFTGQTVGTTVGAAGGASALPATPLGYLTTSVNGSACKIPYYN